MNCFPRPIPPGESCTVCCSWPKWGRRGHSFVTFQATGHCRWTKRPSSRIPGQSGLPSSVWLVSTPHGTVGGGIYKIADEFQCQCIETYLQCQILALDAKIFLFLTFPVKVSSLTSKFNIRRQNSCSASYFDVVRQTVTIGIPRQNLMSDVKLVFF